jgi:hypothetical protein
MSNTDNWKIYIKIKEDKKKDMDSNNHWILIIGTIFKPPTPKFVFRDLTK